MPLVKGSSHKVITHNIKEMVKAGHDPKQAVAAALSHARKYAKGGMVEGEDDDLDQEHERGIFNLMEQADQPPVASPHEENLEKTLAMKLHEEDEEKEMFSMGGLVEDKHDPVVGNKPSESMKGPEHEEPMPHLMSQGGLSEEAKRAILEKKKKRQFTKHG